MRLGDPTDPRKPTFDLFVGMDDRNADHVAAEMDEQCDTGIVGRSSASPRTRSICGTGPPRKNSEMPASSSLANSAKVQGAVSPRRRTYSRWVFVASSPAVMPRRRREPPHRAAGLRAPFRRCVGQSRPVIDHRPGWSATSALDDLPGRNASKLQFHSLVGVEIDQPLSFGEFAETYIRVVARSADRPSLCTGSSGHFARWYRIG
jgi:hypothetical protein